MELLNVFSNNNILLFVLIGILFINGCFILYLVIKERNEDKKEIEELLNDKYEETEEEVIKVQDEKLENNKKEVEEMLMKMQKDLEAKPEDVVSNFESEQEEKSIISYQELLNSVKEKNNTVKAQPIKIEDDKELFDDEDTMKIEPIKNINEEEKKFKGTEFISPIFGRQENSIKYPTVSKSEEKDIFNEIDVNINKEINNEDLNIIDTSKLDNEIRKNDEFLQALKEFRKKLD